MSMKFGIAVQCFGICLCCCRKVFVVCSRCHGARCCRNSKLARKSIGSSVPCARISLVAVLPFARAFRHRFARRGSWMCRISKLPRLSLCRRCCQNVSCSSPYPLFSPHLQLKGGIMRVMSLLLGERLRMHGIVSVGASLSTCSAAKRVTSTPERWRALAVSRAQVSMPRVTCPNPVLAIAIFMRLILCIILFCSTKMLQEFLCCSYFSCDSHRQ